MKIFKVAKIAIPYLVGHYFYRFWRKGVQSYEFFNYELRIMNYENPDIESRPENRELGLRRKDMNYEL